jgi:hypothetical protein
MSTHNNEIFIFFAVPPALSRRSPHLDLMRGILVPPTGREAVGGVVDTHLPYI